MREKFQSLNLLEAISFQRIQFSTLTEYPSIQIFGTKTIRDDKEMPYLRTCWNKTLFYT